MHPGEHPFDHRRERDERDEDDERRDRRTYAMPSAWKPREYFADPPRPLLSASVRTAPSSLPSMFHDRRRAELFPSEHKRSPSLAPLFPLERRQEYASNPVVFPARSMDYERRHQQHFEYHREFPRHEAAPTVQYQYYHNERVEESSTPPRAGKASLSFILDNDNSNDRDEEERFDAESSLTHLRLNDTSSRDGNDDDSSDTSIERYATHSQSGSEQRSPPPARDGRNSARKGSIKKSRICKVDGCTRYVVNKGLCIGHGGGKRCAVAGCTSSAKNMGVCWKHGGSTKCTVDNCENRAKSRGVCWSHGGGRKCKEDGCAKTAVSNGLCWAHGGGKRCMVDGCKKPAYERNGNLCTLHKSGTHAPSA